MKHAKLNALILMAACSPALAFAAKTNGVPHETAGGVAQVILGLIAVLGVIFASAWFLRRMGHLPAGAHSAVRILGGVSMGARERVVLVQVGETQLLLGVAPGRVQTLHVLERPIAVAPATATAGTSGFAERLSALLKQRGIG